MLLLWRKERTSTHTFGALYVNNLETCWTAESADPQAVLLNKGSPLHVLPPGRYEVALLNNRLYIRNEQFPGAYITADHVVQPGCIKIGRMKMRSTVAAGATILSDLVATIRSRKSTVWLEIR